MHQLRLEDCTYREAQIHASEVDAWLGLNTAQIEAALENNSSRELWIGLPVATLLTPYIEFRQILEKLELKINSTVIDCGAGYGRMGFVIGAHYPGVDLLVTKWRHKRVAEAERCLQQQKSTNAQMLRGSLKSWHPSITRIFRSIGRHKSS